MCTACGFKKDLGRCCPDHHEARAFVLAFQLGDVVDELFGQLQLVLAGFDVRAVESFHVILIEDGLHRLDLAQRLFELVQQFFFQHAGVHRCVVR